MKCAIPSQETLKKLVGKFKDKIVKEWMRDEHGLFCHDQDPKDKVVFELRDDRASYVAAHLLVNALGANNITGLVAYTTPSEVNHARMARIDELCMRTALSVEHVDITNQFTALGCSAADYSNDEKSLCSRALKQAALKCLSAKLNARIVNTLDYCRIYTGDFDIDTDGVGEFAMFYDFGDVEIAELAKYLGYSESIADAVEYDYYTRTTTYDRTQLKYGDYFWCAMFGFERPSAMREACRNLRSASSWKVKRIRRVPHPTVSRLYYYPEQDHTKDFVVNGEEVKAREYYYQFQERVLYDWF